MIVGRTLCGNWVAGLNSIMSFIYIIILELPTRLRFVSRIGGAMISWWPHWYMIRKTEGESIDP